jgi:TPR repeat protein
MKRILVGLVLTLLLTDGAAAGPFEEGADAFKRGDYTTALQQWGPLAVKGDAKAQNMVATMYDLGLGVPQDYAEAAKWYRLAADQGYPGAQDVLGTMYEGGIGVPQDYAEAVRWFRLAAEQDNALAQYSLGTLYGRGLGVPQDYVQAHMWLNLAASDSEAEDRDRAVQDRDATASIMTPEQIAEAQRLAREWKAKPAAP